MTWITFATTAAAFIIGPFGIAFFAAILGYAGIQVAITHRWHHVGFAIAGGVIAFAAAWAVSYFMHG